VQSEGQFRTTKESEKKRGTNFLEGVEGQAEREKERKQERDTHSLESVQRGREVRTPKTESERGVLAN
jgi:hypothetical protein